MVALSETPHPPGCTPLMNLSGVWRIRDGDGDGDGDGDYRIWYTIDKGVLIVLALLIHTRDDVYPQLRRLLGR